MVQQKVAGGEFLSPGSCLVLFLYLILTLRFRSSSNEAQQTHCEEFESVIEDPENLSENNIDNYEENQG